MMMNDLSCKKGLILRPANSEHTGSRTWGLLVGTTASHCVPRASWLICPTHARFHNKQGR
jgi:hypothetical protein